MIIFGNFAGKPAVRLISIDEGLFSAYRSAYSYGG
jgi:hypothetical protein